MRLINADTLITWFDNHYDDETVTVGFVSGLIKDEPTIDAVGVVRCEDCKCKYKYENFCRRFLREIDPSYYCSWAERKEL